MDKRQKSRRKTIKAVEKGGLEEEIEKKRAAERDEDENKNKKAEKEAEKAKTNEDYDLIKKKTEESNKQFEAQKESVTKEYEDEKKRIEEKRQSDLQKNDRIMQETARKDDVERIEKERQNLLDQEKTKQAELERARENVPAQKQEVKESKDAGMIGDSKPGSVPETAADDKIDQKIDIEPPAEKKINDVGNNTADKEVALLNNERKKDNTNADNFVAKHNIKNDTGEGGKKLNGDIANNEPDLQNKNQAGTSDLQQKDDEILKNGLAKKTDAVKTDNENQKDANNEMNKELNAERKQFEENERRRMNPPTEKDTKNRNLKELPDDVAVMPPRLENSDASNSLDDKSIKDAKGAEPKGTMDKRVKFDEANNTAKNTRNDKDDENNESGEKMKKAKPLVDITNTEDKEKKKIKQENKVLDHNNNKKDVDNPNKDANEKMAGSSDNKEKDKVVHKKANDIDKDPSNPQGNNNKEDEELARIKRENKAKVETDNKAYVSAGLIPPSQSSDKKLKPIVDEDIAKDAENAGQGLHIDTTNIQSDSEIGIARSNNQVIYEGCVFKRRFFFSCCWHERYFVLTKDGILRYYNDKNKSGKGDINVATVRDLHRLDEMGKSHPYKIMLRYLDREDVMAFDDEPERNRWAAKLGDARKNLL